jgi:Holliday junction DNA helicase RuvA
MIAKLTGTLDRLAIGYAVIEVGGIGYKVFASPRTSEYVATESKQGPISLHIHHVVREDASDLYGFSTADELEMFEHLLSLSGVGPKSALAILSAADPESIRHAVVHDDPAYLTKLSGVGKKTAEKIVHGLKDRFGATDSTGQKEGSLVIDALLSLGYSAEDARDALKRIDASKPAEDQVREALRLLARP